MLVCWYLVERAVCHGGREGGQGTPVGWSPCPEGSCCSQETCSSKIRWHQQCRVLQLLRLRHLCCFLPSEPNVHGYHPKQASLPDKQSGCQLHHHDCHSGGPVAIGNRAIHLVRTRPKVRPKVKSRIWSKSRPCRCNQAVVPEALQDMAVIFADILDQQLLKQCGLPLCMLGLLCF